MKRNAANIAQNLTGKLWANYLERVPCAKKYDEIISQKGGRTVIDHLAFRTLNTHTGEQPEGIRAIKHIIKCLGYKPAEKYTFTKKKLTAVRFEHPDEMLPYILVSQLEVEELPGWAQHLINEAVKDTSYALPNSGIELLNLLARDGIITSEAADLLENELVHYFRRPWDIPEKETVLKLNDISQYAAWVMLHGNAVSHFAASVNRQGVSEWPDFETTCNALKEKRIFNEVNIQGTPGNLLQQCATPAVKEEVEVKDSDGTALINWTSAYFELVQRGSTDENGEKSLFREFITEQERHLFYMTQTLDN
jgi:hypothetical protein